MLRLLKRLGPRDREENAARGAHLYLGMSFSDVRATLPDETVLVDPDDLRCTDTMKDRVDAWNSVAPMDLLLDDIECLKGRLPGLDIIRGNLDAHRWHVPCENARGGALFKWSHVVGTPRTGPSGKEDDGGGGAGALADVYDDLVARLALGEEARPHLLASDPAFTLGVLHENATDCVASCEQAADMYEVFSNADARWHVRTPIDVEADAYMLVEVGVRGALALLDDTHRPSPDAIRRGTFWSKDSIANGRALRLRNVVNPVRDNPVRLIPAREMHERMPMLNRDLNLLCEHAAADIPTARAVRSCACVKFSKKEEKAFKEKIAALKKRKREDDG